MNRAADKRGGHLMGGKPQRQQIVLFVRVLLPDKRRITVLSVLGLAG